MSASDFLAPLREWQGLQRIQARYDRPTPFAVPEYEDFAKMVQSMEQMAVRIDVLEGALEKAADTAVVWVRRAMHLNPAGHYLDREYGPKWERKVREEILSTAERTANKPASVQTSAKQDAAE